MVRVCLLQLRASLAAAVLLAAISAHGGPASYAEFDTSVAPGDGAALQALLRDESKTAIYLQRGFYTLDNPVVIGRGTPLTIHGADRSRTILVAKNPSQPLFLVARVPRLQFAGMLFWPTAHAQTTLHAVAIATENASPVTLEVLDCGFGASSLRLRGPGTTHLQSSAYAPSGRVRASLIVDHPAADVFVFGGDATNGREPLHVDDFAFVWQKRGRVRVYATTFEGGLGPADVRIETASAFGPHVVANVRSEGVSGALIGTGAVSRLLYVPPTTERVDVVLKSNGGAWNTGPRTTRDAQLNCRLAWYNGAGTLWLLGNRAEGVCGRHLVEGNAPQATIVSVGNLISSPQPFPVAAGRIVTAADAFRNDQWSGSTTNPRVRWIPDGSDPPKLAAYENVPPVILDVVPPALSRPTLPRAMPGMLNVKAVPYGAKGDGVADDTAAIQRALDANCDQRTPKHLYFPAGTYRLTNTLYLNHHAGGACRNGMPNGGWIAGAGSGQTFLVMSPGLKKGVFATDGLGYAMIQGITFKTWPWRAGDPNEPNVDLEFYPGYVATQLNNFYDVVFDGGYSAFAAGVADPSGGNCSSNAVFWGRFKNAHVGLASGHFNALANVAVHSEFTDNDYALGSWTRNPTRMIPGGTYYAYSSVSRGSRLGDFLFGGSASGSTWYFYNWVSDAPFFFSSSQTSASWPLFFERSQLTPRPGKAYLFDVGSAQGPFFLHSRLSRAGIRIGQSSLGQSYAVRMESSIDDWAASIAPSPNGQLEEISWGVPTSTQAPAAPMLLD